MILQTMVGSVGLNLTQATRVILVEPWWNPFVDEQAMDRAHRIGQQQQVVVYKCYIPETIEERILKIQQTKREMVQDMWGNPSGQAKVNMKLTKKEIDFLIGR
jgi:SNF2 family DNA or RNA helicase